MQVLVNTDSSITGSEELQQRVELAVSKHLKHVAERLTRVEVHFTDENKSKHGPNDKQCTLEVRIQGLQPVAVKNNADTVDLSLSGALDKAKTTIERLIQKQQG